MIVVAALLGLLLGTLLNQLIAWQLRADEAAVRSPGWLPLGSALMRRDWLALAVEVLAAGMAAALWAHYGWTARFWLLLAATLLLIDTGAIDWRVRLIDTLVLAIGTLLAVVCAPWIIGNWIRSVQGLLAAGLVFVLFFLMARLMYPQQQAPFGLGDVYLGMFIGALLGLYQVGAALFYGMLLAGIAGVGMIIVLGYRKARYIPISYGSFLCLGTLLYLALWGVS